MVVLLKKGTTDPQCNEVINLLKQRYNVSVDLSRGEESILLGLVGDTSIMDVEEVGQLNPHIERAIRVSEPFKKANRKFHPADTICKIRNTQIGGDHLAVIAGPCSVESHEQLLETAHAVKKSGATFLRGGAFKPRTSPYAFQGMELDGLELLKQARIETGLPIVTEIMSARYIDAFVADVDVIQVGARNMQNFDLLKELGKCNKPILLKRGLSSTIEELLMSAEYVLAGGNSNVILCERGIRTFETSMRNTLDISAIPMIKSLSHLPVIVDPSHAAGISWMVPTLSKAAIAAGADGLIIEVHRDPSTAMCDGNQSLDPIKFDELMKQIGKYAKLEDKKV